MRRGSHERVNCVGVGKGGGANSLPVHVRRHNTNFDAFMYFGYASRQAGNLIIMNL